MICDDDDVDDDDDDDDGDGDNDDMQWLMIFDEWWYRYKLALALPTFHSSSIFFYHPPHYCDCIGQ
jgi:hypothetical protein